MRKTSAAPASAKIPMSDTSSAWAKQNQRQGIHGFACLHVQWTCLACAQRRLCAQVPQPERCVTTAARQLAAIWAELHCKHRLCVACIREKAHYYCSRQDCLRQADLVLVPSITLAKSYHVYHDTLFLPKGKVWHQVTCML